MSCMHTGTITGGRSATPFDTIRLQRSARDIRKTIGIQEIVYVTHRSSVEFSAGTGDSHPNAQEQHVNGDVKLEPNTYYRLTVDTAVDHVNGDFDRSESKYLYFRTDEGPGIPPLVPNETETYKGKPVNQLKTYIERTLPLDGAKAFYFGYDMGVVFNEKYIDKLFAHPLVLRLKDRNGKILESPEGAWMEDNQILRMLV